MAVKLNYVIHFVAEMEQSVRFYSETLGLPLKFQSPEWSEFVTGETTLALHPASPLNPAGKIQLGFRVSDIQAFYRDMTAKGYKFTRPPAFEAGSTLARFLDADGTEYSVSED